MTKSKLNAHSTDAFRKFVFDLVETATANLPKSARKNLSLDELINRYSADVDNDILRYERYGKKFVAGKFKLIATKERSFVVHYELYFTDTDDHWERIERSSNLKSAREWLSNSAWLELKAAHTKTFDITAPEY